jgi:hypothetical protein
VTLPETLVVGKGCFFATGNILTSVDVDQGKFNVPCVTYMSPSAEVLSDIFSIFFRSFITFTSAHQPLHI